MVLGVARPGRVEKPGVRRGWRLLDQTGHRRSTYGELFRRLSGGAFLLIRWLRHGVREPPNPFPGIIRGSPSVDHENTGLSASIIPWPRGVRSGSGGLLGENGEPESIVRNLQTFIPV